MTTAPRPPRLHHCTSEPYRFFGRAAELALLDEALAGGEPSVVALVGPGGQGKTAIVQHWLDSVTADGVFLWSFYRGKDADLCLRELLAYAEGLPGPPDVSASWCVDRLLPLLQSERWALVLDGAEVAQHESGPWFGRFLHPELGRLLEELASAPMPGVVALTTRFPVPTLEHRRHARTVSLASLDMASARGLLETLGIIGSAEEFEGAAESCGRHAKAVELLGTYLARFAGGEGKRYRELREPAPGDGASEEERHVARVLAAHRAALPQETQDILALATAFRQPPTEGRLLEYLASDPVARLLHKTWGRSYLPFRERQTGWLAGQVQELITLRLLERVGQGGGTVIDAHPLVRRGFEGVLGTGSSQSGARAGFLRGRPDRRPPTSLEEARDEVELFHAYCDAGQWNEADGVYVALDNPKHRFLAPAFERDLLLRFFPEGDWRQSPTWPGFGRWRSLAICFEMLGDFESALECYRPADAALRGDALLALGRLEPLLSQAEAAHPWQALWRAYRAHALCLAGRVEEAVALARSLVPVDVYEWVHIFECLLRAGRLDVLDLRSVLYRAPLAGEHRWAALARERMRLDYLRVTGSESSAELGPEYEALLVAYDRAGLPYERALVRLSSGRWLLAQGRNVEAEPAGRAALALARRHGMEVIAADALDLLASATSNERGTGRGERGVGTAASNRPCRP